MERQNASVVLTLFLLGAASAPAAPTGTIFGVVTDSTQAVIVGVSVTAKNEGTGITQTVTSDATGNYLFVDLPVGPYAISAIHSGFKTFLQSGVVLQVDQQLRVDVTLQLGPTAETVTVAATPLQVDTRSATISDVVTQTQIAQLPLNGRNVQQLIELQAGVQITTRTYLWNGAAPTSVNYFSISGTPGNSTNYILDGADHNDHWTNVAMPTPNPDALQEFSVQTSNLSAEYGSKAGGVVNMVIKSGTNAFHGSAFEFLRNYALNARDFFAPGDDGLKRNQYGGTLGGPITKDKTFFFVSYQGTNTRQRPSSLITFVPTAAQRAGDLSGLPPARDPLNSLPFPNNQLPNDRLDPTMQNFLALIPLPNGPNGAVNYGIGVVDNVNEGIARVDHSLGPRDKLFGSYFEQRDSSPPLGDPKNFLSLAQGIDFNTRKLTLGETHVFSPTWTNEFRIAYGTTTTRATSAAGNFTWQGIGMQIPRLVKATTYVRVLTPLFSVGSGEVLDIRRPEVQFNNTMSSIRGRHELKVGIDIIRDYHRDKENWLTDGSDTFSQNLTGSPYADLMLGLPATFEQLNPALVQATRNRFMFFAEDTFRMNRKLTLTFGLRYEPYINWKTRQGEEASFVPGQQSRVYPNLPPGLLVAGDVGIPDTGFSSSWNRLGPRLGFAYDPLGDGKTSLRGGFGIFYDILSTTGISDFGTMAPFTTDALINQPFSFTDPYRGQVDPFPAPIPPPKNYPLPQPLGLVYGYSSDFKLPQVYQWNLTIERQLPGRFLARAAYVGSHGTDLQINRDINAGRFLPGTDAQGNPLSTNANVNSRRPYQGYQNVYSAEPGGVSTLNSMLLSVQKRMASGFTISANYTLQKSLDNAPQNGGAPHQNVVRNPLGNPDMYGPSDFDRTHHFVASLVWQMPTPFRRFAAARSILGGWVLTGITTLLGGAPFNVTSAGTPSLTNGYTPDYADYIGGCDATARPPGVESRLQWFNTTCFKTAAIGTFGNLGRNRLRGPSFKGQDLGVYRNLKLTERLNLQFRSEFFNVFNHPNFALPNASLGNPAAFGSITATSGGLFGGGPTASPRVIQFALKLVF